MIQERVLLGKDIGGKKKLDNKETVEKK